MIGLLFKMCKKGKTCPCGRHKGILANGGIQPLSLNLDATWR